MLGEEIIINEVISLDKAQGIVSKYNDETRCDPDWAKSKDGFQFHLSEMVKLHLPGYKIVMYTVDNGGLALEYGMALLDCDERFVIKHIMLQS